jgi:glycosyltransferase involved in cell wall biosynthesis
MGTNSSFAASNFEVSNFRQMKILLLCSDDVSFWRNRLGLACEAKKCGFDVVVMSPISNRRAEIEKEGIRVIPWNLSRKSLNPLRELRSLLEVVRVYRQERPDVVQHEALKAVVHGGVAARFIGTIPSVNIICGLGSIFTRATVKMKILRGILIRVLAIVFKVENLRLIVMNDDNRATLLNEHVLKADQVSVVPGVGVHPARFTAHSEPVGRPIVLLPSRMIWEKGVGEFVAAAQALREKGTSARFVLVGSPDPDNPGCISKEQLDLWERSGVVEWWRERSDMPAVYAKSTLVCLPSYYGEGLPNVLTEAGASGRAVVTTDVPGCRQAVSHEVNGLLVPARDAKALAVAIERLLNDTELRRRLAWKGRERALNEFSHATIVGVMLEIYRGVLGKKWPAESGAMSGRKMHEPDLVAS